MKKLIIAAAMVAATATSAQALVLGGIQFNDFQYDYATSGSMLTVTHSNTGDVVGVYNTDADGWMNVTGHYVEDASSFLTSRLTRYGSAMEHSGAQDDFVMGGVQFPGWRYSLIYIDGELNTYDRTDNTIRHTLINDEWHLSGSRIPAAQFGAPAFPGATIIAPISVQAVVNGMAADGTEIGGWTAEANARGNNILIKTLDSGATIKFRPKSGSLKLTMADGSYTINSTDSLVDLAAVAPASVAGEVSAAAAEFATATDVVNAAR